MTIKVEEIIEDIHSFLEGTFPTISVNNDLTRREITYEVNYTFFSPLVFRGFLKESAAVCNEENNPPSVIDDRKIILNTIFKPANSSFNYFYTQTFEYDEMWKLVKNRRWKYK